MLNKFFISFLTVSLLIICNATSAFADWLIFKKPAYKGKVIDAETKKPIEGAVVVAVYRKRSLGIVESYSAIIEVKEAVTDKNGEFHIPSYTTSIQPLSWGTFTTFIIFKPGYGSFPEYRTYPPKGIPLDVLEEFFIGETGREGELVEREKSGGDGSVINRWKVAFGVVELPKLKTKEERKLTIGYVSPLPDEFLEKQKNLIRLINEEEENLGLQKSDPFKARDFLKEMR